MDSKKKLKFGNKPIEYKDLRDWGVFFKIIQLKQSQDAKSMI